MPARPQRPRRQPGPIDEKVAKGLAFLRVQSRESGQRRARVAVEGRWNTPDTALFLPKLALLLGRVFVQPVGRVGDDSVDAVVFALAEPVETIRMIQAGSGELCRGAPRLHLAKHALARLQFRTAHLIKTAPLTLK